MTALDSEDEELDSDEEAEFDEGDDDGSVDGYRPLKSNKRSNLVAKNHTRAIQPAHKRQRISLSAGAAPQSASSSSAANAPKKQFVVDRVSYNSYMGISPIAPPLSWSHPRLVTEGWVKLDGNLSLRTHQAMLRASQ